MIESIDTPIEYENAVEKTKIFSLRVFTKLLLPWLAPSLWNIFNIWLTVFPLISAPGALKCGA